MLTTDKIILITLVPARWKVQPVDQSAVEGQSVSFHCQVGGVPTPSVTWTVKSGKKNVTQRFIPGGEIKLKLIVKKK